MGNMENIQTLKYLLEKAQNILVTSHVSPDPDSICSMLLLGLTLEKNYVHKKISITTEEAADNLSFLAGFNKIKVQPLADALNNQDLIIVVDAMNFERCTRNNAQAISQKVKEKNIPLAIIDHHQPIGVEQNAVYINNDNSSATQEIYELLFNELKFQKPEEYAEIAMAGIYSDTAGFTYLKDNYKDTLAIAGELISAGAKLEVIKSKLQQYSLDDIAPLKEILTNIRVEDEYTFSYLSDNFVDDWLKSGKTSSALNIAKSYFMDNFSRNINGKEWGFALYKEPVIGDGFYSVSFRAINGTKDVSVLAGKLDGGGHKAAAGGRVQAKNIEEAILKIQKVISQTS
jgi:phosphoesterase RecJ-like protein